MLGSTSVGELARLELWWRSQGVRLTGIGFRRPIDAATAVAKVCRLGDGRVYMLRGIEIRRDFMRRLSLAKTELRLSGERKVRRSEGRSCCTACWFDDQLLIFYV
jgi:hypothetical protein